MTRSLSSIDAARFFPAWNLSLSRYDDRAWLDYRRFIDDNCYITAVSADRPAQWTRRVALPAEHRLSLRIRAAQAGTSEWRMIVRVDGSAVFDKAYAADDTAWHEERIDLTPLTGRTVAITVAHEFVASKSTKMSYAAWQRLEIVEE